MNRINATLLLVLLLAGAPARGGEILFAGDAGDLAVQLKAAGSSVDADAARGRAGRPAARWHGIDGRSRLVFLKATGTDWGKAERISLWIDTGTLRGETLTLLATDDLENIQASFSFPLPLGWEGWHRMEIPLLRFVRSGPILWPQVKHLCFEYTGFKDGAEIFLDEVRLLAPGEQVVPEGVKEPAGPPPARHGVSTEGETLVLADFEKGAQSLCLWVPRDSKAEISATTVKKGARALRWRNVVRGASLEFLNGPFSVEGYDRFAAFIFVTERVESALYVAYGNDADRIAWCDLAPLEPGWNEVVLPLSRFSTRGEMNTIYVDNLVFLYEGGAELSVILDEVRLIAPPDAPTPKPQPPLPGEQDPGPGPATPGGDAVIAGPEAKALPGVTSSRVLWCSDPVYMRQGQRTLRWFELAEGAQMHFPDVPPAVQGFARIDLWIYADAPTGTLEVVLEGAGGEAWRAVDVDWLGWKQLSLDVRLFDGIRTLGRWTGLSLRFEGRREHLREFCVHGIRAVRG